MQYGMYLAAAGALNGMHRMDVHANNLANVETAGFQPYSPVTFQRPPERLARAADAPAQPILEQLGGGPWAAPLRLSSSQGRLVRTGQPLNVGLVGDGFLLLGTGSTSADVGPRPLDQLRLTRDGQLTINTEGSLVHAGSGRPVLDDQRRPIPLPATGSVTIDRAGLVQVDGAPVARLGVVEPTDRALLHREGDNLLAFEAGAVERRAVDLRPASDTVVQQYHLEGSGVDPVRTLNDLIAASRAASSGMSVMRYFDESMQQAIGRLGRVN